MTDHKEIQSMALVGYWYLAVGMFCRTKGYEFPPPETIWGATMALYCRGRGWSE